MIYYIREWKKRIEYRVLSGSWYSLSSMNVGDVTEREVS